MRQSLKDFLDKKVEEYNQPSFIAADPVCIPHLFTKKQDIEIAGFFAAIFAWGHRTIIINKAKELMRLMNDAPYVFCLESSAEQLQKLVGFKHRTFNDTDLLYFVSFFHWHYSRHDSLEQAFLPDGKFTDIETSLNYFYQYFFSLPDHPPRTKKHIAAPFKNATCKRLNMFLRWMVRTDGAVDFGIWKQIKPADLVCPVDLHVARVARRLGLVERPSTDWKTALELTDKLKQFDPQDPAKYDFALFALGVAERF